VRTSNLRPIITGSAMRASHRVGRRLVGASSSPAAKTQKTSISPQWLWRQRDARRFYRQTRWLSTIHVNGRRLGRMARPPWCAIRRAEGGTACPFDHSSLGVASHVVLYELRRWMLLLCSSP